VLHYRRDDRALAGASIAVGEPEPFLHYWVARGSSARRAQAQAEWVPGIRVPLDGFTAIDPPVTLEDLRDREHEIMAIRVELERRFPGQSLYFPWTPYRGQRMRTFESYLVKVPDAVVKLLPPVATAIERARRTATGSVRPGTEVDVAQRAWATTTGESYGRGQGFAVDQKVRVAIESLAMNAAIEHFVADGWDVEDVHGSESYDLRCFYDADELHVEVKGTTTAGLEILLTANEVRHARKHRTALFVLADVDVRRDENASLTVQGGRAFVVDPWVPKDEVLTALSFRCRVDG
jgi:hypothetical protein